MNWTYAFIVGVPLLFVAVVFAMYKFGVGLTDWEARPAGPYREPSPREQLKIIAGLCAVLYLLALFTSGPFGAAVVLAVILLVQFVAVLVFTLIQEIVFWLKGPRIDRETGAVIERRPFLKRLLWNFFNSYEVVLHLTP